MFSAGRFQVDFFLLPSNNLELLWLPPGALCSRAIPPGLTAYLCGRGLLRPGAGKNCTFYQGTFAGYHVRKGAFCYAHRAGNRPRCRSPPSTHSCPYPNIYKRKEIAMSAEMIKKVENLLKSYREREWKIAVLQHKMKNPVRVTETEVAEVMNYAHGDGQGHTPGRVSNKTLYIALNYKEQAERLNTEAAETIAAELFVLEHEHERLKLYISLIDKREAEVLMLLYSEKESAVNVAERLGYSKRTITRIHNAAVAHLAEMYEYAEKYDG